MILVQLNIGNFEYDIHSLVKAFYPSENVSVYAGTKDCAEPVKLRLEVTYLPGEVSLELLQPGGGEQSGQGGQDAGGWEKISACSFPVDDSDRRQTKNLLKQNIYQMLSDFTGRSLPWGTLTGIRPTKIPMKMLEQGSGRQEIEAYMKETYLTSMDKIHLSIEIAQREAALLSRLDYEHGFSLYIGIPFCPSTCAYCSFTSYPISMWKSRVEDYLQALEKEIAFTARQYADRHVNSIYIGGGTPTTLTAGQLDRLLSVLEDRFDFSHLLEFTVEAGRPDSIGREKLKVLGAHKVSRISVNPQTMNQQTLDFIGRRHTVQQTMDSFYLAREMGFDNINMDLIMGLPGETIGDVQRTMESLKKLEPDSITVHSLALKRAAKLRMFPQDYAGALMVNTQEHLDTAAAACAEMGMVPYYLYRQKNMAGNFENTGYAKEGKAGIYNVLIMEEKHDIPACGAGSISKRVRAGERIRRCDNVKDAALYIEKIDEMVERKRKLFEDVHTCGCADKE